MNQHVGNFMTYSCKFVGNMIDINSGCWIFDALQNLSRKFFRVALGNDIHGVHIHVCMFVQVTPYSQKCLSKGNKVPENVKVCSYNNLKMTLICIWTMKQTM